MVYVHRNNQDAEVKEIQRGGKQIRAIYKVVDGVVRKLFGADMIYYGFTNTKNATPVETGMTSFVARHTFGPMAVHVPLDFWPNHYFYMYVPKRYADSMSFYLNDMACTPFEAGQRVIDGTDYYCYRFGESQNGTITIEGRYE